MVRFKLLCPAVERRWKSLVKRCTLSSLVLIGSETTRFLSSYFHALQGSDWILAHPAGLCVSLIKVDCSLASSEALFSSTSFSSFLSDNELTDLAFKDSAYFSLIP